MKKIKSTSAENTQKFAQKFAGTLKGGEIIALIGDLGAGKTTFTQGLAKGLGIRDNITSPTFVLMKQYQLSTLNFQLSTLVHIDAYRMDSEQDALSIGIIDYLGKSDSICIIEWPEKIKNILPKKTIWIKFKYLDEYSRQIIIRNKIMK